MLKKLLMSALALTIILTGTLLIYNKNKEVWPEVEHNAGYTALAKDSVAQYRELSSQIHLELVEYSAFGDFLNCSKSYVQNRYAIFDENGLPLVNYNNQHHYNPVTIAQFALYNYGAYLTSGSNENKDLFIKATDKLIDLQDEQGALAYNFSWTYYLSMETYEPGWTSGMAQGQALSVFARAYHLTQDETYLAAGDKALAFTVIPVSEGGGNVHFGRLGPISRKIIFFEEYLSTPNNYTLNGYMFTLLGLYDWAEVSKEYNRTNQANRYFNSGIKTLIKILPYYDIGGFSAYDLGHMTFDDVEPHIGIGYHGTHIEQLHALHSITNKKTLKEFKLLWLAYISDSAEES